MLGIGFIITHFVAMQKPQQRKYHSGCNRSVHRGIAHGKQRVKVCKRKTPHLLMRSFLSPYGDGTGYQKFTDMAAKFSPPCGDGTFYKLEKVYTKEFSPPYGDGTLCRHRIMASTPVFAPLRGWYNLRLSRGLGGLVFAPLRG